MCDDPLIIAGLFKIRSDITAGIMSIRYHGRNGVNCSDGNMFANVFIPSNSEVTALAAPNFPIVLDAVIKTSEQIRGRAIIAINDSQVGFRLKLKCTPLERGKANI
jgi:hypothetical protein